MTLTHIRQYNYEIAFICMLGNKQALKNSNVIDSVSSNLLKHKLHLMTATSPLRGYKKAPPPLTMQSAKASGLIQSFGRKKCVVIEVIVGSISKRQIRE